MNEKITRIFYLTSFSAIIASIIYFFAANWSGFERFEKIAISVGLFLLFYFLSFLVTRKIGQHPFLGKWFLLSGSFMFGITVALIGQIYNSHADSYLLFLIWFIPTILLALTTRYQPFYITSWILLNVTIWFYTFPSHMMFFRSNEEVFSLLLIAAFVNLLIVFLSYKDWIPSPVVKGLAFSASNVIFLLLSMEFIFGVKGFLTNFFYAPALMAIIYYVSRKANDRLLTILAGIALSLFAMIKYYELAWRFHLLFYFGGILFSGFLVFLIILIGKNINKMKESSNFLRNSLLVFGTMIASFIGASSLLGYIFLMFGEGAVYVAYFMAILVFIILPIHLKKLDPAIYYTLLSIGFFMATSMSTLMNVTFACLLLAVLLYSWIRTDGKGVRYFLYLIGNGLYFYIALRITDLNDVDWILVSMVILNFIIYASRRKENDIASKNSLAYGLLFLLFLTFFGSVGDWNYLFYNVAFFIITLSLIFYTKLKSYTVDYRVASTFWYVFLLLKYYDFGWKLLHKSIALMVIGLIFFAIAVWLDKKTTYSDQPRSFVLTKWKLIIAIIVLQLSFIGYQISTNEHLLSQGELVKLKLQPVDPRSLLQGDYVILNYEISTIEVVTDRGKIEVLLRKNSEGINEYAGVYKLNGKLNTPYEAKDGDVFINGKSNGYSQVAYGIENFFIEEGTGHVVEQNMNFAYVRVGKNGNSILVNITDY